MWPEVGVANQTFPSTLCMPVVEPTLSKFLNPPPILARKHVSLCPCYYIWKRLVLHLSIRIYIHICHYTYLQSWTNHYQELLVYSNACSQNMASSHEAAISYWYSHPRGLEKIRWKFCPAQFTDWPLCQYVYTNCCYRLVLRIFKMEKCFCKLESQQHHFSFSKIHTTMAQ